MGLKQLKIAKWKMELKAKKPKCMLLQNELEVNVKFEVHTPYKRKTTDAINFESVTCYLGRPRRPRFAGTSRRSRIKGKKRFRCNIVKDFLFEFIKIS